MCFKEDYNNYIHTHSMCSLHPQNIALHLAFYLLHTHTLTKLRLTTTRFRHINNSSRALKLDRLLIARRSQCSQREHSFSKNLDAVRFELSRKCMISSRALHVGECRKQQNNYQLSIKSSTKLACNSAVHLQASSHVQQSQYSPIKSTTFFSKMMPLVASKIIFVAMGICFGRPSADDFVGISGSTRKNASSLR